MFIFYGFTAKFYFNKQEKPGNTGLPKNPLNGRVIFENKGCINCHAIYGNGGKTAPDLGKHNFFGSEYELISEMWNHSDDMLNEMEAKNSVLQKFTAKDFQELRVFLYYLRYLGEGGNVSTGAKLFTSMNCNNCHSIGKTSLNKVRIDKEGVNTSPIYLAQVMWNHAVEMQKMQRTSGVRVPVFKDNEFADLSSYITAAGVNDKTQKIYSAPGDPVTGEKIYSDKGCYYCHNEKHTGPDLKKVNFNKSVLEIAGLMWNHSGQMEKAIKKGKIATAVFKGNEMADLIAFLYFNNQSEVNGSAETGEQLILEKGCINCHTKGNSYNAPEVSAIGPFGSEDEYFSELWNHLPLMAKDLYLKGKSLSKLSPPEIKSLYLYFNSEKH